MINNQKKKKKPKRKNKRNKRIKDQAHQVQVEAHPILHLHNLGRTEKSVIERGGTAERKAIEKISVPDQRIEKRRSKEATHDQVLDMMRRIEARRSVKAVVREAEAEITTVHVDERLDFIEIN